MNWIEPIFDRTYNDISFALLEKQIWINELSSGKTPQITELKGCLNASDLNRIENNITYLIELYSSHDYQFNVISSKINWVTNDIPTATDVNRILVNINYLINRLDSRINAVDTFKDFNDINNIERIQNELFEFKDKIFDSNIFSDTFYSNEEVFL